jgi:beta-mannosidase
VMSYVFAEWRRQRSTCHGALVWFCRDLWPGAGWGVIDSTGYPKAAYYYLKRVLLPQACFFSDEGLNGLYLHIINDMEMPISTEVLLSLYRFPEILMATVTKEFPLSSHEEKEIHVDGLFEGFKDLTYAYRFGSCSHNVIVATVIYRKGANSLPIRSEAFYFPQGLPTARDTDIGLSAQATLYLDGTYELHVHTEKFAQSIAIRAEHCLPEDNYFHLQPGGERTVLLYPREQFSIFRCSISALNTYQEVEIEIG